MKKSLFFIILLTQIVFAQSLYIPLDIQKAYTTGTRSYDGMPGENYWQNSSDYFISADFNPHTNLLKGKAEIIYHNNSPKALKRIVMRLYPNYFKKGGARENPINPKDINDGMKINSLVINGDTVEVNSQGGASVRGTNMLVQLPGDLQSGSTADIEIEWSFYLPHFTRMRMGQYDSTSFYIAYWYPQIAVYDDIDGWDMYQYTGTTEFYNDFNNYHVDITVPEGFLVWAAGTNNNIDELLKPEILQRWENARTSDEVVNIVTEEDYANGSPTLEDEFNTWSFTANNITDFTFATSDHYLWDMVSLVVDATTGRRTVVDAAYKKESKDFYQVAEIAKNSIKYFSYEMPAVPFPYPKLTVFNGSGGMEAPMMVNDGSASTIAGTVGVTSHEIAHTYFPFYMGINERKYAFMDEGWATMLPIEFQKREGKYNPLERNVKGYARFAADEMEMPMMIPSVLLQGSSYRNAAYSRPGIAYYFLWDMLGNDKFLKALHHYINVWNGKHPIPYDFFYSFNNALGEDLSWYWKPWFFERTYPDLAVKQVKENKGNFEISIEKLGGIPVPAALTVTFFDDTEKELYANAGIWKNSKSYVFNLNSKKRIKRVQINTARTPDAVKDNNEWVLE